MKQEPGRQDQRDNREEALLTLLDEAREEYEGDIAPLSEVLFLVGLVAHDDPQPDRHDPQQREDGQPRPPVEGPDEGVPADGLQRRVSLGVNIHGGVAWVGGEMSTGVNPSSVDGLKRQGEDKDIFVYILSLLM